MRQATSIANARRIPGQRASRAPRPHRTWPQEKRGATGYAGPSAAKLLQQRRADIALIEADRQTLKQPDVRNVVN